MCSIFGYVARADRRANLRTLERIVESNIQRGPHAFGFAWIDTDGRLHSFRQRGKLVDHLGLLSIARDATMLIGHLRYATHGNVRDNINNHPHPSDGGWIVHNGVIHNHASLNHSRGLMTSSECDSETLALLIEQGVGSVASRAAAAVGETKGNLAMLGLWSRPGTMIVARRGNPLHVAETADGIYIGTLADGLPGKPQSFLNDTVRVFRRKDDGITVAKRAIESIDGDDAPLYRLHVGGEYRGG